MDRDVRITLVAVFMLVIGVCIGFIISSYRHYGKLKDYKKAIGRNAVTIELLHKWCVSLIGNRTVSSFIQERGIKNIAIYGAGVLGHTLYREICGTGINVKGVIDRDSTHMILNNETYSPSDIIEGVDMIVVTTVTSFYEIRELLAKRYTCPIVSLKDILMMQV